jgi:hypothetical protein
MVVIRRTVELVVAEVAAVVRRAVLENDRGVMMDP